MVRSFALLSELPIFLRPAKSHTGVRKYTPQSFYDTLELGEVKRILAIGSFFRRLSCQLGTGLAVVALKWIRSPGGLIGTDVIDLA
jgi:hypothetical protein